MCTSALWRLALSRRSTTPSDLVLLLTRPYPDELISSALVRGCRHFGLSMKQVFGLDRGSGAKGMSFFGMTPLPFFAELFGMEAKTILTGHTVLPYATAFSEHEVWKRAVANSLSQTGDGKAMGAVIQSAVHGIPNRRFCPACVADDVRTRGESYWHLSHQLPGSLLCHLHGDVLRVTSLRIAGVSACYDLPQDVSGRACVSGPVPEVWQRVAARCAELSRRRLEPPSVQAGSYYRDLAVASGWFRNDRSVDGERLEKLLVEAFGKAALVTCGLVRAGRVGWTKLMLHTRPGIPFTTLKHVLMEQFLAGPVVDFSHKPSGPSARARSTEDRTYAAAVRRVAAAYAESGRRARIADVLQEAGCWNQYRHAKANALPQLSRVVRTLQTSSRAHRPQALQMLTVPGAEDAMATRQDLIKAGHLLCSKDAAARLGVHWTEMKRLQRGRRILCIRYAARDWYPAFWCEPSADRTALEAKLQVIGGLAVEAQWSSLVRTT